MLKIIDKQFKVYSEVKMTAMVEIEQDTNGDYRTYLSIRYPDQEKYSRHSGTFHTELNSAMKWCREQLTEENLSKVYELQKAVDNAMAVFYSKENRSKYDYNE